MDYSTVNDTDWPSDNHIIHLESRVNEYILKTGENWVFSLEVFAWCIFFNFFINQGAFLPKQINK